MSKEHGDYVRHVQEETRRYSQGVLAENDRLRTRLALLEADKASRDEMAQLAAALKVANEALQTERAVLLGETERLRGQIAVLREEVAHHEKARLAIEARLQAVEADGARFSAEYESVAAQNSNLANLYVASYRLHGTLDRAEVLLSIQEIVSNLIGSEEMALFEREPGSRCLHLVASFGIDPEPFQVVPLERGLIGRVACSGDGYLAGRQSAEGASPEEGGLSACIPLKLDGEVTGALAVFRLLSQKKGLGPLDDELFDLLTSQAAIALYCTGLHARQSAGR